MGSLLVEGCSGEPGQKASEGASPVCFQLDAAWTDSDFRGSDSRLTQQPPMEFKGCHPVSLWLFLGNN